MHGPWSAVPTASSGSESTPLPRHVPLPTSVDWATDASRTRYRVEAVVLVELGHCVGLDHSASPSAVMYASCNGLTELDADDVHGTIPTVKLTQTSCNSGCGPGG